MLQQSKSFSFGESACPLCVIERWREIWIVEGGERDDM